MAVTTRNIIRVGATPKLLASIDGGSGSLLIMTSEIIAIREREIDLHVWRSK